MVHAQATGKALQIRAGLQSITTSLWHLSVHIYHVMTIATIGFSKKSFFIIRVQLIFLNAVMKIYPSTALCWVNKNENMSPKKFPQLMGQYVSYSCSYWKQIYCLKLYNI